MLLNDRIVHLWGSTAGDEVHGDPELVIVPSYWGNHRFDLLGRPAVSVSEALLELGEPARSVSFLVEVEAGRVCISRLDFAERTVAGTLLHHDGRPSDVVLGYLEETGDDPDDCEFIVAAGLKDPMIADLWRRGLLAYPVPVHLLGKGMSGAAPVMEQIVEPVEDALGIDAIRARMRGAEPEPRSRTSALTAAAAVAVLAAVGAVTWQISQRAGQEEEPVVVAEEKTVIPESPGPELTERAGEGFALTMPSTWDVVPEAVEGMLVLHDGGTMRVLATVGERVQGLNLEAVQVGLTEIAETNPEIGYIRTEQHDGDGFIVHEERPEDGSVVIWHHRMENDRQLSVGCQYRGPIVPQVRPQCTEAVVSMRLT